MNRKPEWVCSYCGETYGRNPCPDSATWHLGECGVCGDDDVPVTQPREFDGLLDTWMEAE